MSYISAVVYDPPKPGFPFLVVVFDTKGEIVVSRPVPNRESGEALIESAMAEFAHPGSTVTLATH